MKYCNFLGLSIFLLILYAFSVSAVRQSTYSKSQQRALIKEIQRFYENTTKKHQPRIRWDAVKEFAKAISSKNTSKKYPVLLVTALGGAQLEAKLNMTKAPHWFCERKSDWELVWLNFEFFLPLIIDCWAEIMKLKYDPNTHVYSPTAEGVKIRVRNGTDSVRFIDPQHGLEWPSEEYNSIIDALVMAGYTEDKNIVAAPFDWRVGADAYYLPNGIFYDLKSVIEATYVNNSHMPLVCVAESLGAAMFNLFLNTYVNQAWKDKYIRAYISLSGVYAGSGMVAYSLISPSTGLLPPVVNSHIIRSLIRTYGSSAWLLPNAKYWKGYPFVRTGKRNYTASDFDSLFDRIGLHNFTGMWHNNRNLTAIHAPNVTVYCWHGTNIDTPNSFYYKNGNFNKQPVVTNENGDGRVPLYSLQVCEHWKKQQTRPVSVKSLPGVGHMGILYDEQVVKGIVSIATGGKSPHF